jgi:Tol biopolymer transport system component
MSGLSRGSMLLLAAIVLAALTLPASAAALYGNGDTGESGADLVSAEYERLEQGDDSTVFAAISADGRYVAIQTRARNFFADDDPDPPGRYRAGGIFRFDLQTDALEKVADGDLFDEASNVFLRRGASNPSISADGRFIAFATAEPILPADVNDNSDVYVRDMAIPIGAPGAFDLVSVRDGGDAAASYGSPSFPFPGSEPGAEVSGGAAISADGQKVVFHTEVATDLPASDSVDVPPGQVLLRDREANTTTLVSALRDQGSGAMTGQPAGGAVGATISADGTTVSWTGENAPAQTRFLGGENPVSNVLYYLWRRVADGPMAPTRRVTGIADPDDPACPADEVTFFSQTGMGPCFGPLTSQESARADISSQLPALSGDGYTVAFLTGEGPRPNPNTGPGLDLYVTDMTPGLTRKATTVELTRETVGNQTDTGPPLSSISMSAGGRYLVATTVRTRFALPALQLLGEPRSVPGPRELYVVDLQRRTLERVTHSLSGGDINASVLDGPTISADGERIAFSSFASNLFFGDANQRSDAFVSTLQPEPEGGPLGQGSGSGDPSASIELDRGGPAIGVRARSMSGGEVLLLVSVPAAGGVKAVARARLGEPRKPRALASETGRALGSARSVVRILLQPVDRYRAELRERRSVPGRVAVSYVASRGGRRASASVRVVFREGLSKRPNGSQRGRGSRR